MEIETKELKVTTVASNFRGFTNVIKIYLHEVIHELTEDESGIVTHIGSYHRVSSPLILLDLRGSFNGSRISQLLSDQQVPHSEDIGQGIALGVYHSFANNDISLQDPVFVTVDVKLTKELRFILPPSAPLLKGAPLEVFQRLVKEQRVDSSKGLGETCSICMENLSSEGTSDQNYIIQMPQCLHMFHEDCLFEWLARKNSCPLCRRVPYEGEYGIETQRLA